MALNREEAEDIARKFKEEFIFCGKNKGYIECVELLEKMHGDGELCSKSSCEG